MLARSLELLRCYRDIQGFHSESVDAMLDFCSSRPIAPLQVRDELAQLVNIVARHKPKSVLEIGTARGGTLWLWCRVADASASIISVDLPHGQFGGGYHWAKTPLYKSFAQNGQKLRLIRGDSHTPETLSRVKKLIPGSVDFLFIDGDHSYAGVKRDFEMYSPLVGRGGLIALHDILPHATQPDCQVHRFWNEIKLGHEHQEIVLDPEQGWAGIGVIRT